MFRYLLFIIFIFTSLSGCAWKFEFGVEDQPMTLHFADNNTPLKLSNISMSRRIPKLPVDLDGNSRDEWSKDELSKKASPEFPDVQASEADWNAYWQKRFPQTNVFARKPKLNDDWFSSWDRHYSSPQNRPIETMQLGDGKMRVMVLGSLHGNESVAMYLAEQLAQYVSNKPVVWKATSSLVVRSPNPDGAAKKLFTNSRGVDLNRNFPTENFIASRTQRTGQRAGSEVETQIICRIMTDFKPNRVVHIKTSSDKYGYVIYNNKGKSTALMMGDPDTLRPKELESLQLSGSMESYVTSNRKLEMITLVIPNYMSKETAWRLYREPLLTAITFREKSKSAFEGTRGLNDQSSLLINPRISRRPERQPVQLKDIFNRYNPVKLQ